jgi:putative membrane protein
MEQPYVNRDLILREYLAIERTHLANQRTFMAYVRTGLYFIVAGSTLGHVVNSVFWKYVGSPMMITGTGIVIPGLFLFLHSQRKIRKSKKQIGKVKEEFIHQLLHDQ